MTIRSGILIFILFFQTTLAHTQSTPKREFRGVWIASVANIDWPSAPNLKGENQREEFRKLLDHHRFHGMNAVIVQIRPSADAFYRSSFEPWSEWLSGSRGSSPSPEYDPLTFMVEEAHERGLEFHAWLNPYRAIFDAKKFYSLPGNIPLDSLKLKIKESSGRSADELSAEEINALLLSLDLDTTSLINKHPDWFLEYGNKIYFDPGVPAARVHIAGVVREIVANYDIDAIHMDDYFYPYKIAGVTFPDHDSFAKYGSTYSYDLKDYWRRDNVNAIVKKLSETVRATKPWVKFGISPFGIWRNKSADPAGSETSGQANYDDLYADVLKWQREKWIDYVIPQIYWHRGFDIADYNVLVKWWNDNTYGIHVYIGHGLYRVDGNSQTDAWRNPREIPEQVAAARNLPNIQGSCFYSSKWLTTNPLGVSDILRDEYFQYPALIPEMSWLPKKSLLRAQPPKITMTSTGVVVNWEPVPHATYYVVYRSTRSIDKNNPASILSILPATVTYYKDIPPKKCSYSIAALNRLSNESELSEMVQVKWKKPKK